MRKLLFIAAVACTLGCRRDRKSPGISADPTPRVDAAVAPRAKPSVRQGKYESKEGDFTTTLAWPIVDLPNGVGATITKTIEDDLRTNATAAQDEWESTVKGSGVDAASDPSLQGWFVDSTCSAALVSYEFVSVLCEHATYTGGAHEMAGASTYNWSIDGASVRRLKIGDVVGNERVTKLAEILHAELKKRGAAFVVDGTVAPTDLFYQDDVPFVVDRDGFTFVFSPYVVGPWSDGEWRQHLDWKTLATIAGDAKTIERVQRAARDSDALVAEVFGPTDEEQP